MTPKDMILTMRDGGKLKSATCPLTQGDNFIAKRQHTHTERFCVVAVNEGQEEIIDKVLLKDLLEYDDWTAI